MITRHLVGAKKGEAAVAVDERTLGIVWAETARLVPCDGSDVTKQRLQAVVGRLVDRARSLGSTANFAVPAALPGIAPAPGGEQAEAMRQAVNAAITTGQFNGNLSQRAVLWEVTATGEPREIDTPVPGWAKWIKQGVATRTSDFKVAGDSTGRVFRLYESDAEPGLGAVSYVSAFTNSGVPPRIRKPRYFSFPWIMGGIAALLFFWMVVTLGWTGRTVAQARDLMNGSPPEYAADVVKTLLRACTADGQPPTVQPVCTGAGAPPETARNEAGVLQAMKTCLVIPRDAPSVLRSSSFCRLAWRVAAEKANTREMTTLPRPFGSIFLTIAGWAAKPSGLTASISITLPLVGFLASIALLGIALGYGAKGNIFGVWISPQNRISLARMQVSLWTIVILGGYAALALFNIGALGEAIRDFYISRPGGADIPQAFPDMPAMILAALGIAVGSPMLSAVIKNFSAGAAIDLQARSQVADASGIGRFADAATGGNLEVRPTSAQASLFDLFTGETQADKDQVDVSRLQNVVLTLILVCSYATLLFGFAREISPDMIVRALDTSVAVFPSLPDPGGTFATLLAASHATYLVAKGAALRT